MVNFSLTGLVNDWLARRAARHLRQHQSRTERQIIHDKVDEMRSQMGMTPVRWP